MPAYVDTFVFSPDYGQYIYRLLGSGVVSMSASRPIMPPTYCACVRTGMTSRTAHAQYVGGIIRQEALIDATPAQAESRLCVAH